MVIPGKIYEYLAAGKPIVNIAKAGSETDIHHNSLLCRQNI
jgi:hypothetical protein